MPFEILRVLDTVPNGWLPGCVLRVRELQSMLSSLTITELLIATAPSSIGFFFSHCQQACTSELHSFPS